MSVVVGNRSIEDTPANSWRAHVAKGNSLKLLQRMDRYYNTLMEEVRHANVCKT